MKTDTTYQIELDKLQDFMNHQNFDEADKLVTRMLEQYNKLDYELLLKRARIRQCLFKYEDAVLDANLAQNILPQRMDAYYVLSDFFIALNDHQSALKQLEILNQHEGEQNPFIKNQYEQIKQNLGQQKQQIQSKQFIKMKKQIDAARRDCLCLFRSPPENSYQENKKAIKQFFENQRMKQINQLNQQYSKDTGLPHQLFQKKSKEIRDQHIKNLHQDIMYLSDELDEKEDTLTEFQKNFINEKILGFQKDYIQEPIDIKQIEEENKKKGKKEKPGNAQHLESPNIVQPLDFSKIKVSYIFKDECEHYMIKPKKMQKIECRTCSLLYDYTNVCKHLFKEDVKIVQPDWNKLQGLMLVKSNNENFHEKINALRSIMICLEQSSTLKQQSMSILKGHFSQIVTMFLRKDLNDILGDYSEQGCSICSYKEETQGLNDLDMQSNFQNLLIIEHALLILNRCLTYQVNALIRNKMENLLIYSMLEDQKLGIGVNEVIEIVVWDELKQQIENSQILLQKKKELRFCTLSLITHAFVNILILSQEQKKMIKKMKKSNIIQQLLQILMDIPHSILQFRKTDVKAKRNIRYFVEFSIHIFRLVILAQSIDSQILSQDSSLKVTLNEVLRRFELFKQVFPQNTVLLDSLSNNLQTILLFEHNSSSGCNIKNFYQQQELKHEFETKQEESSCQNCKLKNSDQMMNEKGEIVNVELKVCSRCKKVQYCSRECQKAHYRAHKRYCLTISQDQEDNE